MQTEKLAAECKVKRTELSSTSAQLGLLTESIEKLQAELSKSKRGNGKYKAACVQLDSALLKGTFVSSQALNWRVLTIL